MGHRGDNQGTWGQQGDLGDAVLRASVGGGGPWGHFGHVGIWRWHWDFGGVGVLGGCGRCWGHFGVIGWPR